MAGFFAAAANTPISTVIMVSEMTGNYQLLVPSMMVCLLGFLLVRRHSIYEQQVPTRADDPSHSRDMMSLALGRLRVADALALRAPRPVSSVGSAVSLEEVYARLSEGFSLAVVDERGRLRGEVTLEEVSALLGEQPEGMPVVASDLAVPAETITRDRPLHEALHRMVEKRRNELLIVEGSENQRVVDVLTNADVNAIFESLGRDAGGTSPPFGRSIFGTWLNSIRGHRPGHTRPPRRIRGAD